MVFRVVVVTDAFVLRDIVGIPVKTIKVTHVPNAFHFIEKVSVSVEVYSRHTRVVQTVCTITE